MLAEYQKAPAVTRDRLYIDTMQQVYGNVTKVMVDSRNGSNLLYLPLDKLLQQSGAMPTGTVQVVPQSMPSAAQNNEAGSASGAAAADSRSRDGSRSRDRDGR